MSSSRIRWVDYNKFSIFGDLTNHTEFEPDGTMVFHGDARTYNDLYTGVAGGKVPAANYPDWSAFTTNTGAFTFKVNDYIDLSTIELTHDYAEGTNLEVHLHLVNNGTDVDERKVKYIIYYTYGEPDSFNNQFSAEGNLPAELTLPANVVDKSVIYLSMGTIDGTNIKMGTQIKFRVKRIASTGTEPTGNPFLGMVGVHYQQNTLGSRTILGK